MCLARDPLPSRATAVSVQPSRGSREHPSPHVPGSAVSHTDNPLLVPLQENWGSRSAVNTWQKSIQLLNKSDTELKARELGPQMPPDAENIPKTSTSKCAHGSSRVSFLTEGKGKMRQDTETKCAQWSTPQGLFLPPQNTSCKVSYQKFEGY